MRSQYCLSVEHVDSDCLNFDGNQFPHHDGNGNLFKHHDGHLSIYVYRHHRNLYDKHIDFHLYVYGNGRRSRASPGRCRRRSTTKG
jgi:hypothetical protein